MHSEVDVPRHWKNIKSYVDLLFQVADFKNHPTFNLRMVDYGCGTGALSHYLVDGERDNFSYLGLDNNNKAIYIAREQRVPSDKVDFKLVQDVFQKRIIEEMESVKLPVDFWRAEGTAYVGLASGLIDRLENGEEALDALFEKKHETFILSKLRLTTTPSYSKKDEAGTCEYFLNTTDFGKLLEHHKYVIRQRDTYDVQGTSIMQPTSCQMDCLLSK